MTSLKFLRGHPGLLLKPSGSQWWIVVGSCDIPCMAWKMSEPPQSSASNNAFQLGSAVASLTFSFATLSFQKMLRILHCHLWCAAQVSSFGWLILATVPHCTATWREIVLHIALFSPINWFSCSSIFWIALKNGWCFANSYPDFFVTIPCAWYSYPDSYEPAMNRLSLEWVKTCHLLTSNDEADAVTETSNMSCSDAV